MDAMTLIYAERTRQDKKWGVQDHTPDKWCIILTEEVGEVAKATLDGTPQEYLAEMVQVAAVAVAAIEAYQRRTTDELPGRH